jgi:predicted nuclease of predicted toxin-antitoxin system
MKVLLDSCVWGGAREILETSGHDTKWAGNLTPDPGDEAILNTAYHEKRVLVTLDKDFGELAIVYDKPHCGIIRLVGHSARRQGPVCA